jgi:hypothetical protein
MWGIGRSDRIVDEPQGITKVDGVIAISNVIGVEDV